MKLNKFISNLREVKQRGLVGLCEEEIKHIFYEVLSSVAEKTIVDTGQSASSVIQDFVKHNQGYTYRSLLIKPLNYWGNKDRHIGGADTQYSQEFNEKEAIINLNVNDVGLAYQEQGVEGYPSEFPPRDNSKYIPHHITYVIENIWKQPEVKKQIEDIKMKVEKGLFKN